MMLCSRTQRLYILKAMSYSRSSCLPLPALVGPGLTRSSLRVILLNYSAFCNCIRDSYIRLKDLCVRYCSHKYGSYCLILAQRDDQVD